MEALKRPRRWLEVKLRLLGLVLLLVGCLAAPSAAAAADTVTVTKHANSVQWGNSIRYTVTVKSDTARSTTVTMTVPQNTSLGSSCGQPHDPRLPAGTTFSCPVNIPANSTGVKFDVFLETEAMGQVDFTATVADSGASGSATTPIVKRQNHLTVTLTSSPQAPTAGQVLTYTAVVRNTSATVRADGVVLDWTAPANGTVVSSSCGSLSCALGTLTAGQQVTVTLQVQTGGPGVYEASAAASSTTSATASGSASPTVAGPPTDLAASIGTAPATAFAGNTITYTITVANNGPNTASGVQVTVTLPAGMAVEAADGCAPSGATLKCDVADIGPGASGTATIKAQAAQPGDYPVTASVASTATETRPGDNSTGTTTTVFPKVADLSLTINNPSHALPAPDSFRLGFVVTSPVNSAPGESVRVNVTLPDGATAAPEKNSPWLCPQIARVLECQLPRSIAGGTTRELVLIVRASRLGANRWSATLNSSTPDPNRANNSAAATVDVVTELPKPTDPDPPTTPTDPDRPDVGRLDLTAELAAKSSRVAKGIKVVLDASRRASVRLALAVKQKRGALTLATKTVRVSGERTATLKLSKTARRAVSRLKRGTKLVLTVTATPASGRAVAEKLVLRVAKGGRLKAA